VLDVLSHSVAFVTLNKSNKKTCNLVQNAGTALYPNGNQ